MDIGLDTRFAGKGLIRKAVIPAAGLGTRFLPATKATPKEMLCLVDKPLIQYAVEEAVAAGCSEVIIITSRGKATIEDHFDVSPELEFSLLAKRKDHLLEIARSVSRLAKVIFVRQPEPLGLGHAVLMAKEIIGNDPFAVLLPDDVMDCTVPCLSQMVSAFTRVGCSVVGSEVVPRASIGAYGCLAYTPTDRDERLLVVDDLIEKPSPERAPSSNAIVGRYVLTPKIFECIERLEPGAGGELQLTDALRLLLKYEKVYGYVFTGKRHDAGDKQGFLRATVELGLKHPVSGGPFREWLASQTF